LWVTLSVAGGGAEGGVAAVVVVTAALEALAGLASSAGVSLESGCFCVRDTYRSRSSAS
jgi:hypothetical protein